MTNLRLDHVAVAVHAVDPALRLFRDALGGEYVGDGPIACAQVEDDTAARFGDCTVQDVDGRPAILAPTDMGEPPEVVTVEIAEDGGSPVAYEVAPTWGEPYYPNGRRCGGSRRFRRRSTRWRPRA